MTPKEITPTLPKYFADSASIPILEFMLSRVIFDGITTNPGIFKKELRGTNMEEHYKALVREFAGYPVSIQLGKGDVQSLIQQAMHYADFGSNVVVKLPMFCDGKMQSTGEDGKALILIAAVSPQRIKLNVTALMDAQQAINVMHAGIKYGKEIEYVSLFFNRMKDGGEDPQREIGDTREYIERFGLRTQIIVGSIRNRRDITLAEMWGAHIVTIPPERFADTLWHPKSEEFINQSQEALESSST